MECHEMFRGCKALVDLSPLRIWIVDDNKAHFDNMFADCPNIKSFEPFKCWFPHKSLSDIEKILTGTNRIHMPKESEDEDEDSYTEDSDDGGDNNNEPQRNPKKQPQSKPQESFQETIDDTYEKDTFEKDGYYANDGEFDNGIYDTQCDEPLNAPSPFALESPPTSPLRAPKRIVVYVEKDTFNTFDETC